MKCLDSINDKIGGSFIGKFFKFEERGAKFSTELAGATATFLTMAYILAVNPRILADSGGPCVAPDGNIFAPEYEECLEEIKRQYITSTAIGAMVGCLLMGLMANLPIALAPGMGMVRAVGDRVLFLFLFLLIILLNSTLSVLSTLYHSSFLLTFVERLLYLFSCRMAWNWWRFLSSCSNSRNDRGGHLLRPCHLGCSVCHHQADP